MFSASLIIIRIIYSLFRWFFLNKKYRNYVGKKVRDADRLRKKKEMLKAKLQQVQEADKENLEEVKEHDKEKLEEENENNKLDYNRQINLTMN